MLSMDVYPFRFEPIYLEKIWGGRNLERLFGRRLPDGQKIGESWELADLEEGVSVVANGPLAGTTLTELTRQLGSDLLGGAAALDSGRFPLLLKLLDANDTLSLQVHPDADAVAQIGPPAALKTECWYVLDSRGGYIYKGVKAGVDADRFRQAIETDTCEDVCVRFDVAAGDFHYLPAGTVHALGKGVVVAEVQTPSDTTYRVTDWGRGREIHIERSMQCIHFEPPDDAVPGQAGDCLLATDDFTVHRRATPAGECGFAGGRCTAWMVLSGGGGISSGSGGAEPVAFAAGDTVLLPAAMRDVTVTIAEPSECLEITLPDA